MKERIQHFRGITRIQLELFDLLHWTYWPHGHQSVWVPLMQWTRSGPVFFSLFTKILSIIAIFWDTNTFVWIFAIDLQDMAHAIFPVPKEGWCLKEQAFNGGTSDNSKKNPSSWRYFGIFRIPHHIHVIFQTAQPFILATDRPTSVFKRNLRTRKLFWRNKKACPAVRDTCAQ